MTTNESTHGDARDLVLSRELDAPRELVWTVLTTPEHLDRWWGPSGFRTVVHSHDLRPGGAWHLSMHGPDGRVYPNHAIFDEVDAPRRIVLRYLDGSGATDSSRHVTTITLDELGPKRTRITLAMRFATAEDRRHAAERVGAVDGGQQTLGRLARHLDALQGAAVPEPAFEIRRVLAAPPELVWAAWTDASHLNRWFHPESWTIFASELDLRVGGTFFYGFRGPDVPDTWALWRFTEVDAPKRLEFELSFADAERRVVPSPFGGPWPARVATTVTIEHHAGIGRGTVLTVRATPLDATDAEAAAFRDAAPSMQTGWGQTLDSLAAHLLDPS